PHAPCTTLFPYTTLFRSLKNGQRMSGTKRCSSSEDRHQPVVTIEKSQFRKSRQIGNELQARPVIAVLQNPADMALPEAAQGRRIDRKSTRLNSSHLVISY